MSKGTTRLSRISPYEYNLIDALMISGLDLTEPFTAKDAVRAILTVPTKKGYTRKKVIPSTKFHTTLRKHPSFEKVDKEQIKKQKNTRRWRLIE